MTYTFIYRGELREGAPKAKVAKNLSLLFKVSAQKIESLFDGQHEFIVADLSKEVASDYQRAFSRAGAVGHIVRTKTTEKEPDKTAATQTANTDSSTIKSNPIGDGSVTDTSDLDLEQTAPASPNVNKPTSGDHGEQDLSIHSLNKHQSATAKWLKIGALSVIITMIIDSQLQSILVVDRFGLDIGIWPLILAHLPLAYGCYLLATEKKLPSPYLILCLLSFAGLSILMMLPKKGDRNHKVPLSALLVAIFSCGVLAYWFGGTAKVSAETEGYYQRLYTLHEGRAEYPKARLQNDDSLFVSEREELLSLVYEIIEFIDADELRPDQVSELASSMMSEIARYISWRQYQRYLFLSQGETPPNDLTAEAQLSDQQTFSSLLNGISSASHPRFYEEVSFWIAGSPNSDVFYAKYGKQIELNDMHNAVFDLWILSQDKSSRSDVQQADSTQPPALDLTLLNPPPLRGATINRYQSHIEYAFSTGEFAGKVLAVGFYTKKNKPRWNQKVSFSPVYKVINSEIPAVKISGLLNVFKDYTRF